MSVELDPLSGFSNYGGQYPVAAYNDLGGTIFLEGLLVRPEFGNADAPLQVVQLPEEARPAASLIFDTFAGDVQREGYTAARMDVDTDGFVTFQGLVSPDQTVALLSLSGISFPVAGTTRVPAAPGGDPIADPLLIPGQNYLFRCNNYEFEATMLGIAPSTPAGRPGAIQVQRGTQVGWINADAISFVWEMP